MTDLGVAQTEQGQASLSRYAYRAPGAYIEFPRGRRTITPRRTDIVGVVGLAERGPLDKAVRVETWAEFTSVFGAHIPGGYLGYAVEAFFANGGKTAWVVRVAGRSARPAQLKLRSEGGSPVLTLTAGRPDSAEEPTRSDPGTWGNRMEAVVARDDDRLTLTIRAPGGRSETWRNLVMDAGDPNPRSVVTVLNDVKTGSQLATVEQHQARLPVAGGPWPFTDGHDDLAGVTVADLVGSARPASATEPATFTGLRILEEIDEIGILMVPDLQTKPWSAGRTSPRPIDCRTCEEHDPCADHRPRSAARPDLPARFDPREIIAAQKEVVAQCARTADRFAILDSPLDADAEEALAWRRGLETSEAAFSRAAAYYPWVVAPDPIGPTPGAVRAVPPSGYVAGLFARCDRSVGVHKPPANKRLELAIALAAPVDQGIHGDANVECLNVLRSYRGRGIRVAGSRTLHCAPPWRFVNVRRLIDMIEEAVSEDLAWAVFEANDQVLWLDIERLVRGFLDELWRRGMLDGATAAEAYDVRCDAETNPPDQVDLGRVTCLIGLQPPLPAEFVIVRVTVAADGSKAGLTGVNRA